MIDFIVYVCISLGFLTVGAFVMALFINIEIGDGEKDKDEWT